ncbi:MAG: Hsp20/alpha crystallin family protein [Deltaproteobacteria bacterium]|nr:Hsp20/alpha crystallin family protein [Deltaproteobacteria bacterium]
MSRLNGLDLYRPGASIWNMLADVDTLFDRYETATATAAAFSPRANIEETENAYLLSFDLPGVKKEDLKVDVHGRTFILSGERKRSSESDERGFKRYECVAGKFTRSFTLPVGVDAAKVEASLLDGVLNVTVPKSEAEKPRTIMIK